ncbi:hypothetical protein [Agrobacterium tumefaciens]
MILQTGGVAGRRRRTAESRDKGKDHKPMVPISRMSDMRGP